MAGTTRDDAELPPGVDLSPLRSRRLGDEVATVIRELIVSGHFPAGARLNEYRLAEALNISRTPLREALNALSAEGLVRLVPGRGAYVESFDPDTVTHLVELRMALECMAARLTAQRADPGELRRLEYLLEQTAAEIGGPDDPYPSSLDFHRNLLESSGNALLARSAEEVLAQLAVARRRSAGTQVRAREALDEHGEVLAAIKRRDAEAADRAMRRHLARSLESIRQVVATSEPAVPRAEDGHGRTPGTTSPMNEE